MRKQVRARVVQALHVVAQQVMEVGEAGSVRRLRVSGADADSIRTRSAEMLAVWSHHVAVADLAPAVWGDLR